MKLLLTGGAGFIGTHVREALAAHDVVVFDSLRPDVHRGEEPDILSAYVQDFRLTLSNLIT